jgi:hypothetical protein
LTLATLALFVLLSASQGDPEEPRDTRGEPAAAAAPAPPAEPASRWRWGGSLRSRLEVWDWFNPPTAADDRYAFLGAYARVSLARTFGRVELFVEGSLPVLLGLPEGASLSAPQGQLGHGASYRDANGGRVAVPFARQAYVRIGRVPDAKSSLRVGRFEFLEGQEGLGKDATLDWIKRERIAQRLLAHFAFTHVQRTTDGIELTRRSGPWHLLAAAGRPTEGVFKLDANRGVRDVAFTYAGLTRATARHDLRLFYIFYRDDRGTTKVDARPLAVRAADPRPIDLSTVGGHYAGHAGRADLLLWGALQTGRWGAQPHRAGAWVAEAGYQPALRGKPWLRGGVNWGSGDGDPSDRRHGTFFQMMPTARIYARFPFFNMMNTEDAFVQAIVRPHARVTLRTDYHRLRLSSARDLWYAGGGVFDTRSFGFSGRPSSGQRTLAALADLQADFRPSDRTVLSVYYGHARGGGVVRGIYPAGVNANLFFLELAQRF